MTEKSVNGSSVAKYLDLSTLSSTFIEGVVKEELFSKKIRVEFIQRLIYKGPRGGRLKIVYIEPHYDSEHIVDYSSGKSFYERPKIGTHVGVRREYLVRTAQETLERASAIRGINRELDELAQKTQSQ